MQSMFKYLKKIRIFVAENALCFDQVICVNITDT